MDYPILHSLRQLRNSADNSDSEQKYLQFAREFHDQRVWILNESSPAQKDQGLLNVGLNYVDDAELPFLFAYLGSEPGVPPESLPEIHDPEAGSYIEVRGVTLMGFSQQQRIDVILISDADNFEQIDYKLLDFLTMSLQLEEQGNEPLPADSSQGIHINDMPTIFSKALYQYCAEHRDIQYCRLGFASLGFGQRWSLLMLLDSGNGKASDEHLHDIQVLATQLLPVGIELTHLSASDTSTHNIVTGMVNQPPFYSHTDSQTWFARLKRRFNPPLPLAMRFSD
ncbi:hypothetical protein I2494_14575 [Budviciaceae bacterium BWR-B9]|uniref:Uncharacterized protein n=1 Tax=Limnobaculum allomyrinae TaxID=2791986 RepID=A0ABS1IT44_9GAMM|nr:MULTISPECIES: hypothetical protein [Limnobaculum]MBK5144921.1 hypothetical protein [Limnobaculum allomyrinae]MBV7692752.1 hypothetical protein [Limnobaculum sp. M2-1]